MFSIPMIACKGGPNEVDKESGAFKAARIADFALTIILATIASLGTSGVLPFGVGIGFLVPAVILLIANIAVNAIVSSDKPCT